MKSLQIYLVILFVQLLSINAQKISGYLRDEYQHGLAYVNIGIVGLDRGIISNEDNMYNIDILSDKSIPLSQKNICKKTSELKHEIAL